MNEEWRDEIVTKGAAIDAQEAYMADHPLDGYEDELALIDILRNLPPAQPEDIARDIATIIENEKDMRVILKNAKPERTETHSCVYQRTETHARDLIDRQAAIDGKITAVISGQAIEAIPVSYIKQLPSAQPEDICSECDAWNVYKNYAQPQDIARDIATIIENEKDMRVVLQQQWIPTSKTETIPDHEVLACDKYGEEILGYLGFADDQWICESDSEVMYDPIAWMEKPEPYKGVTE